MLLDGKIFPSRESPNSEKDKLHLEGKMFLMVETKLFQKMLFLINENDFPNLSFWIFELYFMIIMFVEAVRYV